MEPLIRNISDTARLAAAFRALETQRPDALFRDPHAARLAGERGMQILNAMPPASRSNWAWVTRTYLFDCFVSTEIRNGADMVVNLAAGLDTRPYRMELARTLTWIEVDLPDLLAYKEDMLRNDQPRCSVERVRLDLSNVPARRDLFDQLGRRARRVVILTEGLLIYLTAEQAGALAEDLARPSTFERWVLDIASPGLLRMLQKQQFGSSVNQAGAPLQFAPEQGADFFRPHGWRPLDVQSTLKTAARLKRAPLMLRLFALLPESKGRQGSRPWSGMCLMERTSHL